MTSRLSQRELLKKSMAKEWANWLHFQAVTVLDPVKGKKLAAQGANPIPSRWVHTNKNEAEPQKGFMAQPRLVAVGCREWVESRTDSPTASLVVFHLTCSTAARRRRL